MAKIIFFTAGSVPTAPEIANIDKLRSLAAAKNELVVRNGAASLDTGGVKEPCDEVAGTVPAIAPYNAKPVRAVPPSGGSLLVQDGQVITLTGGGTGTIRLDINASGVLTGVVKIT